MNYMVAVIRDDNADIVGYSILNTENMRIVNLNNNDLIDGMKNKGLEVQNLEINHCGKVKGYSGGLHRYKSLNQYGIPINNKEPWIIIGRADNGDLIAVNSLCKIKRLSPEEAIRYAKHINYGIANMKVVGDTIRAIKGSIPEYKEKYKGESSDRKLKPIISLIGDRETPGNQYRKIKRKSAIRYNINKEGRNGEVALDLSIGDLVIRELDDYDIIEVSGYTLFNNVPIKLDIKRDEGEIREYLRYESNIKALKGILKSRGKTLILNNKQTYGNISSPDCVNKYYDILKKLDIAIYKFIDVPDRNLVVNRECTDEGIKYNVLTSKDNTIYVTKLDLEYIYAFKERFSNVKEIPGGISILTEEQEDFYIMDKVYKDYKNKIYRNITLKNKAILLGGDAEEVITQQGVLLEKYNTLVNTLKIDNENILKIANKAIKINKNNKALLFGKNIKEIEQSIWYNPRGLRGINHIIFECDPGVSIRIILNMLAYGGFADGLKITYNRDITGQEFANLETLRQSGGIDISTIEAYNIKDGKVKLKYYELGDAMSMVYEVNMNELSKDTNYKKRKSIEAVKKFYNDKCFKDEYGDAALTKIIEKYLLSN